MTSHHCGVFIVFLSTSVFFESAHICKDLQKFCRSAHICKDLQKSCRSAQILKDQNPGSHHNGTAKSYAVYRPEHYNAIIKLCGFTKKQHDYVMRELFNAAYWSSMLSIKRCKYKHNNNVESIKNYEDLLFLMSGIVI